MSYNNKSKLQNVLFFLVNYPFKKNNPSQLECVCFRSNLILHDKGAQERITGCCLHYLATH